MELVCSNNERVNSTKDKIQECCRRNNIQVTVNHVNGVEDIKALQIDVKTWCVLLLDETLIELLESCGKFVSKIIKITSKPNKLIFMKLVNDGKFEELMEMFETPCLKCVNSEDELIHVCATKSPSEYDELTNTVDSFSAVGLQDAEPLSTTSILDQSKETKCSRQSLEPAEHRHSFSSDDNPVGNNVRDDVTQMAIGMENNSKITNGLQHGNTGHQRNSGQQKSQPRQIYSYPIANQSVQTNNLFPSLPTQTMTSYVHAGLSHGSIQSQNPQILHSQNPINQDQLQSQNPCRPLYHSLSPQSFNSSGPPALSCLSGLGYNCHCMVCPSSHQHTASFPQFDTSQLKSFTGSDPGKHGAMNNINFRPEILDINRQYAPSYEPNIQTTGSDNRAVLCSRLGHISRQEQSDVGPSCETCHSAGGASGIIEKEYMDPDKASVWDLKEEVMVMIRDTLDCSDHYNWKKLADLHKWSFGQIYQLEQKWKTRKIDSPFMHLIEEFQHYTLNDLKEDLKQIPRKDLLQRIEERQSKGLLFHT